MFKKKIHFLLFLKDTSGSTGPILPAWLFLDKDVSLPVY